VNKTLNKKQMLKLSDREAIAIRPKYTDHLASDYMGFPANLKLPDQQYQVTYKGMTTDKVLNWKYPDIGMIVSDKAFHDLEKHVKPLIYKAYQVKDQQNASATSWQFQKLIPENEQMPTYYSTYSESRESNGLSMFVFGFLGLIFLVAMGSILYFKQLSEAHEDIDRYVILRKIGLGKKEIRSLIFKQTLFVFALPLIIGIAHSLVIIAAFSAMLGSLIGFDLTIPILYSMAVYFIIYLGFYLLTVKTYNNLVNQ
jgi:putative ABC transport system permease protein